MWHFAGIEIVLGSYTMLGWAGGCYLSQSQSQSQSHVKKPRARDVACELDANVLKMMI